MGTRGEPGNFVSSVLKNTLAAVDWQANSGDSGGVGGCGSGANGGVTTLCPMIPFPFWIPAGGGQGGMAAITLE